MKKYLETRNIASTNLTAGSDLTRHLLARQHLGKVVVICDKPVILMSVVRKYWFRLARSLQTERSRTLNAEKILQLTHDITHMQRMEFTSRTGKDSRADVFFLTPEQATLLPTNCFSVYVLADLTTPQLHTSVKQLPERALVIDYSHNESMASADLLPKKQLEDELEAQWQHVDIFLREHHIHVADLIQQPSSTTTDNALDTLLSVAGQFIRASDDFLELLRLAQPLHLSISTQQSYDLIATLNRRIYALTPGTLSQQFIHAFNDDELSLHDVAMEDLAYLLALQKA